MIDDHVKRLKQGQDSWNQWRRENPTIMPDLSGADLSGLDLVFHPPRGDRDIYYQDISPSYDGLNLSGTNLDQANLAEASLQGTYMEAATLRGANLARANLMRALLEGVSAIGANMNEANLTSMFATGVDFSNACLEGANLGASWLNGADFGRAKLGKARLANAHLHSANFDGADLSQADLSGSDLTGASFINVDMTGASLRYANVYGANVWDCRLENSLQASLRISPPGEHPQIEIDDIALAQFTYVLMQSDSLRKVLNVISHRAVMILGRFSGGQLDFLRAIGEVLRGLGYRPMLFDFDRPDDRNYTETVKTLVGLARFVIVDLSGPSVPQELYATVPHFKIPFIPIIQAAGRQYAMFRDLLEYPWVFKPIAYGNNDELLAAIPDQIVGPAEQRLSDRQAELEALFGNR